MTRILAIDPGPSMSAWVVIDAADRRPVEFDKVENVRLFSVINQRDYGYADRLAIEMVASYGMAVGREVFETCVWIGRFYQHNRSLDMPMEAALTYRRDIKLHHCGQARAKDSNIRQALVDRFAPGQPNHGKGTKAEPGWFYGFKADIWQAYALAVYAADERDQEVPF